MPSNLIYNVLKNPQVKNQEITKTITYLGKYIPLNECMVCGTVINKGIPGKKAFSGNFNDWNDLKVPDESHVCPACRYTLQEGWLRNYPYIASKDENLILYISKNIPKGVPENNIIFRERSNLLNDLFSLEDLGISLKKFIVCIPSSRKHMAFKSVINSSKDVFVIQFGENKIFFNRKQMFPVKETLQNFYNNGFSKDELRTGEYQIHKTIKYGLNKFKKEESILKAERGHTIFDLLIDLLYK